MDRLAALANLGQSLWIDDLSREMIVGALARRVAEQGLKGVTSNPTIFEHAIHASTAYDADIRARALAGDHATQIYERLTTTDVRDACDVLRPVYDETACRDGYVSLEVSPHLARDAQGSIAEATRLWRTVDRPNLMIKIPGTRPGLDAIEALLFDGINVNITLLFSVRRYEQVATAYMRALRRRLDAGQPVAAIASVASFFLSRIDVMVDALLRQYPRPGNHAPEQPDPHDLLGRAAIANARLAYRALQRVLRGQAWKALAAAGAQPQRLLWASTSTKEPAYSDVMYVEPLIGPHTVDTLPGKTIAAFADHGVPRATIAEGQKDAQRTMRTLKALGIDIDHVTEQLEIEGIAKFIAPYDKLVAALETKRAANVAAGDIAPLAAMATRLRRDVIEMTTAAGSGHPTSCMSMAEIVAALMFRRMRWDPSQPKARDVDTFVLSKGHAAPILWAALHEAGAIREDILSLRRIDSTLEGHPTTRNPWVRVNTGSLGQGLAAANGIALANRLDGIDAKVYCVLGDGECSEGSVWEAAQFASLSGLGGVVAIVDENGLAQSGPAPYDHRSSVFAERFRAFGWQAIEIDGHDLVQVLDALSRAAAAHQPYAIVARTVKGRGVSFVAGQDGWHGKAFDAGQRDRALAELGDPPVQLAVEPRHVRHAPREHTAPRDAPRPDYRRGDRVATRTAFGNALVKLGEADPDLVVIDGDVQNSTGTKDFGQHYPERFFEGYIAEQNMVGAALGLASCGKTPVAATFACFLTRASDFIRMAAHTHPKHLVLCGSHCGISIGEDGPSQMGLEDIALFRALNGSTVLYPCDAVSAERLTEAAAHTDGIVYLRTTRPKTEVLYENDETFPVGGSKTLRESRDDDATIVAAGITVHEALKAHDALRRHGIAARVIDAYSVKPIDVETLRRAARETRHVVVVEDHWIDGGLGDAVAAVLDGDADLRRLAVRDEPRSGDAEELLERYGISSHAIEQAVLASQSAERRIA
ncbi:MAG: transketolase [Proteobacteria bacterium]|nr:transketolase [Pseudomonadota bacterium]